MINNLFGNLCYQMKVILITLILISTELKVHAQMIIKDTGGVSYTTKKYKIVKDSVKFFTLDSLEIVLNIKKVLYIKENKNLCIAFLSEKKKWKITENDIDTEKMITKGKIDAVRFYKTNNKPLTDDAEYLKGFKEETATIESKRTMRTIQIVCGIIAGVCVGAVSNMPQ